MQFSVQFISRITTYIRDLLRVDRRRDVSFAEVQRFLQLAGLEISVPRHRRLIEDGQLLDRLLANKVEQFLRAALHGFCR